MMIDKQKLLDILTSEIESSTGCTDPGSVCLAVAVAAHTLGRRPEKIDVLVSPNIYKNGVSVGIPGTNRIGLELAAALGALLDEAGTGVWPFWPMSPVISCSRRRPSYPTGEYTSPTARRRSRCMCGPSSSAAARRRRR